MNWVRGAAVLAAAAVTATAMPATAQFYMKSRDYSGTPVQGDEPGIMLPLPNATPAERRAGLVWTMRAALNVAALQCDFAPTLTTVVNYNSLLHDHRAELDQSWSTLGKYFTRVAGKGKPGTTAQEHYQTQTWSSFSTVAAQYNFCQTAASVGRDALFTPRGELATLAEQRLRELRNSLTPYGEQQDFIHYAYYDHPPMPRLDPICWSKKNEWVTKKCGAQNWPPVGQPVAAR